MKLMKTYTLTLTVSIEAENEKEALKEFTSKAIDELNTGENIEIEEETEKKVMPPRKSFAS